MVEKLDRILKQIKNIAGILKNLFKRVWPWLRINSQPLTAISAISAAVLAFLVYDTSIETLDLSRNEFRSSIEQTDLALKRSDSALALATASHRLSSEVLELEKTSAQIRNRPHIELEGIPQLDTLNFDIQPMALKYIVKNMGEVPATHIRVERRLLIDGGSATYEVMRHHFLAPRDTLHIPFRFPANEGDILGADQSMEFRIFIKYKGIVDPSDIDGYEYKIVSIVKGGQFPPKQSVVSRRTVRN